MDTLDLLLKNLDEVTELTAHVAKKWHLRNIIHGETTAAELELEFTEPQRGYPSLPVAVVFRRNGDRLENVRAYYSTWSLTGNHRVRPALFDKNKTVEVPEPMKTYHRSLEEGSWEIAKPLFDEEAYMREPCGGESAELEDFFIPAFQDGGIPLVYHTFFSNGEWAAAEYSCLGWGKKPIPAQAGMEFWRLNRLGRIASVHIYDDVEQPK